MLEKPQKLKDKALEKIAQKEKRAAEAAAARAPKPKRPYKAPPKFTYRWGNKMLRDGREHVLLKRLAKALEYRIDGLGDPKNMTDEQVFKFCLMQSILSTEDEQIRLRAIYKGVEMFLPKPGDRQAQTNDLTRAMREFMQNQQRLNLAAQKDVKRTGETKGQVGS